MVGARNLVAYVLSSFVALSGRASSGLLFSADPPPHDVLERHPLFAVWHILGSCTRQTGRIVGAVNETGSNWPSARFVQGSCLYLTRDLAWNAVFPFETVVAISA